MPGIQVVQGGNHNGRQVTLTSVLLKKNSPQRHREHRELLCVLCASVVNCVSRYDQAGVGSRWPL